MISLRADMGAYGEDDDDFEPEDEDLEPEDEDDFETEAYSEKSYSSLTIHQLKSIASGIVCSMIVKERESIILKIVEGIRDINRDEKDFALLIINIKEDIAKYFKDDCLFMFSNDDNYLMKIVSKESIRENLSKVDEVAAAKMDSAKSMAVIVFEGGAIQTFDWALMGDCDEDEEDDKDDDDDEDSEDDPVKLHAPFIEEVKGITAQLNCYEVAQDNLMMVIAAITTLQSLDRKIQDYVMLIISHDDKISEGLEYSKADVHISLRDPEEEDEDYTVVVVDKKSIRGKLAEKSESLVERIDSAMALAVMVFDCEIIAFFDSRALMFYDAED